MANMNDVDSEGDLIVYRWQPRNEEEILGPQLSRERERLLHSGAVSDDVVSPLSVPPDHPHQTDADLHALLYATPLHDQVAAHRQEHFPSEQEHYRESISSAANPRAAAEMHINQAEASSNSTFASLPSNAAPRLYTKRWFMLLLFALITFASTTFQLTFAAGQDAAESWWGKSPLEVNLMALTYFCCAIPFTFVAGYLLETQGVQRVVWLGGGLITLAGWIRFAGYGKNLFWLAFVGQTVGGVAQCMVGLNVLMPLGVNWFGDKERMIASTIGMLCNILGMGGAYAIVPAVVGDDGSRFFYVLLGEAVYVTIVTLLLFACFRGKPPTPPSVAAVQQAEAQIKQSAEERQNYFRNMKRLGTNPHFMLILTAFGCGYGVFQGLATVMNQLLTPQGYTAGQAGIAGLTLVLAGIVSSMIAGILVDKTREYKLILWSFIVFAEWAIVGFCVTLHPNSFAASLVCIVVFGMSGMSLLPVGMDLAVELTYPFPEGTSSGLLYIAGTLMTIVVVVLIGSIQSALPAESSQYAAWVMPVFWTVATVCAFCIRFRYRRLEAERARLYVSIADESSTHLLEHIEEDDVCASETVVF